MHYIQTLLTCWYIAIWGKTLTWGFKRWAMQPRSHFWKSRWSSVILSRHQNYFEEIDSVANWTGWGKYQRFHPVATQNANFQVSRSIFQRRIQRIIWTYLRPGLYDNCFLHRPKLHDSYVHRLPHFGKTFQLSRNKKWLYRYQEVFYWDCRKLVKSSYDGYGGSCSLGRAQKQQELNI